MWFENTTETLKAKGLLLSLRILAIPALLICSNLSQEMSCAAAETDQLDPALFLLHQPQVENTQQAEKLTAQDNTITSPDAGPELSGPPKIPIRDLLHNAKSLFFHQSETPNRGRVSTTNPQASSQQQQEPQNQLAADQTYGTSQTRYFESGEPSSTPKDDLLKASISPVTPNSDSPNKKTLSHLIEQISSMKLRPKPKEPQPQSQPQDEPKEPISDAKETEPAETEPTSAQEVRQQHSAQTLNPEIVQRLKLIVGQSGTTDEPQLLADMLYQTGHYELAAYFYELAISRDAKADVDDSDKAWLMMQKAVCLSDSDPQQALQIYKNLISQYPASPWVELAKSQESRINWVETQQPENLIEQCRKDLKAN